MVELLSSPFIDEDIADGLNAVVVDLVDLDLDIDIDIDIDIDQRAVAPNANIATVGSLPIIVIGIIDGDLHRSSSVGLGLFDVIIGAKDPVVTAIVDNIERYPIASTSLAVLLRNGVDLSIEQALAAESAVYSLLQSGPEFAAWKTASSLGPPPPDKEPAVVNERMANDLRIELNRPSRHNAFSRSMRDGLFESLAMAISDDSIERVTIAGRGPSFCSGGDLGEFGTRPDPATAHRTRLTRSPGRLLAQLDGLLARRSVEPSGAFVHNSYVEGALVHKRLLSAGETAVGGVTVELHGACLGAGVELAAFASHVTATNDASIGLPEVFLGLIPGAGGTVSLPRRIGRQRTAYLGLGGQPITAETALRWGLIDEIVG